MRIYYKPDFMFQKIVPHDQKHEERPVENLHRGRGEAQGNLNGIPTDQNTGKENAGHNDEKGV